MIGCRCETESPRQVPRVIKFVHTFVRPFKKDSYKVKFLSSKNGTLTLDYSFIEGPLDLGFTLSSYPEDRGVGG